MQVVLRLLTQGFSQCVSRSILLTKGITNLLACLLEFTHFIILPPQLLVVLCCAPAYTRLCTKMYLAVL
jgi:hypothetical protein